MHKLFFAVLLVTVWTLAGAQKKDLYDIDHIPEFRLYFDSEDWADKLDSLKEVNLDQRLPGELRFAGKNYQIGARYKGNSSFNRIKNVGMDKLPFNIKVDELSSGQNLPGEYSTLKLSNVFRDPSFLREVLSYEIIGKYMPAPKANFAVLYVNDKPLGLYNSTESVDEKFLLDHFQDTTGILFKCDPLWNYRHRPECAHGDKASLEYLGEDSLCYVGLYELKSPHGWGQLIRLTKALDNDPAQLERMLNIDQTLWMLAFNNVLVNLDSYNGMLCHNYYLYQDRFGMFHPIVWDMNLSFGAFRHADSESNLNNEELQKMSPLMHYRNEKRPLISKILTDQFYRKIYLAHMRTIYEENFGEEAFRARALEIQKIIAPYVSEDEKKLYTLEDFEKNLTQTTEVDGQEIIGLLELMDARFDYLAGHPLMAHEPPVIEEVEHEKEDGEVVIRAQVHGAEKVWIYYRYQGKGNFERLEMTLNSGDSEQAAADNRWMARFDHEPNAQYYLVAESDKAAALSPQRASFEFHSVD